MKCDNYNNLINDYHIINDKKCDNNIDYYIINDIIYYN